MADTVDEGGIARPNPDNCVVLDRDEAIAELKRGIEATDRLAFAQGFVGGVMAAALAACVWWASGVELGVPGTAVSFAFAGVVAALWWRIWDASGTTVTLMGWELKNFAAALYDQAQEEAHGGRADG